MFMEKNITNKTLDDLLNALEHSSQINDTAGKEVARKEIKKRFSEKLELDLEVKNPVMELQN